MRFIDIKTEEQLFKIFPLMKQLVPSLPNERTFCEIVERKTNNYGYRLIALEVDREVVTVAGYRFNEYYALGRFLFLDDLVTEEAKRSKGYGVRLFQHLVSLAKKEGCAEIHLDTGINLNLAHRFYSKMGMKISHLHLTLPIL